MPFLPFRITPALWAIFGIGTLIGLYVVVDAIGDIREAKVRAEYAEAERQTQIAINQSAEEAERARGPAALPGALKRLQTNWCRDCPRTTK